MLPGCQAATAAGHTLTAPPGEAAGPPLLVVTAAVAVGACAPLLSLAPPPPPCGTDDAATRTRINEATRGVVRDSGAASEVAAAGFGDIVSRDRAFAAPAAPGAVTRGAVTRIPGAEDDVRWGPP